MNAEPPKRPTRHADGLPPEAGPREWMSALADGRPEAVDAALARWREDPAARQAWHAYHLIGDVLRSDELASTPKRDAAFLAALRTRLADEPVPLAPQPAAVAAAPAVTTRLGWRAPAAVAAGFAAVAAVIVLLQPDSGLREGPAGPVLAGAPPMAPGTAENVLVGVGGSGLVIAPGRFIRNPVLDEQVNDLLRPRGPSLELRHVNVPVRVPASAGSGAAAQRPAQPAASGAPGR